jgi:hypothetical protein
MATLEVETGITAATCSTTLVAEEAVAVEVA